MVLCPTPLGGRSGNRSRCSRPTSSIPLFPLPPLNEPYAASPAHSGFSDPQPQGSVFSFVWFDSRIGGILWSLQLCSCVWSLEQRAVCSELVASKRSVSEIDTNINKEWEVCCVQLKKAGVVLPNFSHDMCIKCYPQCKMTTRSSLSA